MTNGTICTIPCTTDAGVERNIKMASTSLEINDYGSTNALVSDPVNSGNARRSRGKTWCIAGVTNFGLPRAKSIVGR
ncbi:MAG: hypothetical protein PHF86_13340 [Candidatus Nanoarchaeia archaeon]|jgi:hypothetical protein|nr:hypothetical protein [Candidatus Nanoarchaeia archaeon]